MEPAILKLLNPKNKSKENKVSNGTKSLEDNTQLPNQRKRGVKSSVGIAAAITAYARISLNRFKNLPDNKYLGGDTDSAIMQFPLPEEFVGPGLGMMKYEDDIKLGLFADKKLYYAVNSEGKENIKSRGVGKDFNRKDILKVGHFLLMLAGHVVSVNKTKFVITKNGAVEIKNVSLDTKIQEITYKHVVTELEGYLANHNHPKFLIARYISSLRNISDSQMKVLLKSDSKVLLNLFSIKPFQKEGVNIKVFTRVISESLSLTTYKANGLKLVLHPKVRSSTQEWKNVTQTHPPPTIIRPPGPGK